MGSQSKRATQAFVLAVFLGALFVSGTLEALSDVGTPTQELPPLPFDPPSSLEANAAAEAALTDPSVRAVLDGHRYALLGVSLGTEKTPGLAPSEHQRLFDVWFYDYTENAPVWAVVDPALGRVERLVPVDSVVQPPLAAIEVERARGLALTLPSVAERFPGPVPVTAILVSGPGTPCPEDRCAVLAFIEGEPVHEPFVLVNLSQDHVVRVADGWQEVLGS